MNKNESFKLEREFIPPIDFIIHNDKKEGTFNFDIQITIISNTIKTYSLERLNLLFETQIINSNNTIIKQYNEHIISINKDIINIFRRGELIGIFKFNKEILNIIIINKEIYILFKNNSICIYSFKEENNIFIKNEIKELNYIINSQDKNIKNLYFKKELNKEEELYDNIFNYTEKKIILISKNKLIIYNIIKSCIIYTHNLNKNIITIDILNKQICVIGFIDSIIIFNLKKGIIIFEYLLIKENIKKLSFMNLLENDSSNLLILTNKILKIMDLNTKQIIFKKENIISSQFIKNTNLFCLITLKNTIEIWKVENKKCLLFKKREFPINSKFIELINKTNLITITDNEIFNLGIYKDEQTYKYSTSYSKFINSFENRNNKFLIQRGNLITFLNEKKEIKFIENINEKIINVRLTECGNLICFIFEKRIVVMDFHKMIFKEFKGNFIDIQISLLKQKIFLLTINTLICMNIKGDILFKKEFNNLKRIYLNGPLFIEYELNLETLDYNLILLDSLNGNIMRNYNNIKSYQLNYTQNKLIIIRNNKVEIINLLSNKIIQELNINNNKYNKCRLTKNEDLLYLTGNSVPIRVYRNMWLFNYNEIESINKNKLEREISWEEKENLLTEIIGYCQIKKRDN